MTNPVDCFTEIGTTTFGSGAGITWTFDAGATDPTIAFASNAITATAATVTVQGGASNKISTTSGALDLAPTTNLTVTLAGTGGMAITSPLGGTVDALALTGTPSATLPPCVIMAYEHSLPSPVR